MGLAAAEYKIELQMTSGEEITLFHLGYRYEDFWRELNLARTEMLLKDMLLQESLLEKPVPAEFVYYDGEGVKRRGGMCSLRL